MKVFETNICASPELSPAAGSQAANRQPATCNSSNDGMGGGMGGS